MTNIGQKKTSSIRNKPNAMFYAKYYFLTEIMPLLKLFIVRGGLFVVTFMTILFIAAFYNTSSYDYAISKVYVGILPTIKWIFILFFVVVYGQRAYSKWLFIKWKKDKEKLIDYSDPVNESDEWKKWHDE